MNIKSYQHVFSVLCVILIVFIYPCYAQQTSLSNFVESTPELTDPFLDSEGNEHELTIDIQNALAKRLVDFMTARTIEDYTAVLDELNEFSKEQPVPVDFLEWAYLKQISMYALKCREDLAIKVGKEWMEKHPDNPRSKKIRCVLLQFVASRESDHFKPTLTDLEKIGDPLFNEEKYSPYDADIIDAHLTYSRALHRFYWKGSRDEKLIERQHKHLLKAKSIIEEIVSSKKTNDEKVDERITEQYIKNTLNRISRELK